MPAGMPYMAATNQRKDVLRLFSFPNSFYTILRVFRLWIFFYIFCVFFCVFSKYILKRKYRLDFLATLTYNIY